MMKLVPSIAWSSNQGAMIPTALSFDLRPIAGTD